MDEATANDVIMAARAHWFDGARSARAGQARHAAGGATRLSAIAETTADDEPETGPLRRCIVTRERQPKERMIRFVVGPDRTLVPDLLQRCPDGESG